MDTTELSTNMMCPSKRKYHLHIDLDREYEPLQKKNTNTILSSIAKDSARQSGKKHVDIWCDGKIYPTDPTTMSTPNFSNATSLIKFIGDGQKGLLGYCHHLLADKYETSNLNYILKEQNAYLVNQQHLSSERVVSLKNTIADLEKELKISRLKRNGLGWKQRNRPVSNIETLKHGSGGLKKRIRAIR